jgi:hypothetical protein
MSCMTRPHGIVVLLACLCHCRAACLPVLGAWILQANCSCGCRGLSSGLMLTLMHMQDVQLPQLS